MVDDILQPLTPKQLEAVTYRDGPLMIVAGAGTGKTTVLTSRIAWLIEKKGVRPENIVALTFTEKASVDMETRLDQILPLGQIGVTIATFHGFGQQLLSMYPLETGVGEETTVLSAAEQLLLIRDHIMQFPLTTLRPLSNPLIHSKAMLQFFARCKDELITPDKLQLFADKNEKLEDRQLYIELAQAYHYYQNLLDTTNALDYGDLLLKTFQLLQNRKVRLEVQQHYTHLLVDEYQDTNFAQTEITKLLSFQGQVTIVGDDDQSIYRFRGASIAQMEQFQIDFHPTVVTLTENFRSPQFILDAAYPLIQHNNPYRLEHTIHINKKLTSKIPPYNGQRSVSLQVLATGDAEATWVVDEIRQSIENGRPSGDHCILVRTNTESRPFQYELERQGIPYTTESASLLGHDATIRLLMSYLKVLVDPKDYLTMFYLASSPVYLIPGSEIIPALTEGRQEHRALETVWRQDDYTDHAKIQTFLTDLTLGRDALPHQSTSAILLQWINHHNVLQKVIEESPGTDEQIVKNVTAFFDLIRRFERTSPDSSVLHFLDSASLLFSDLDAGISSDDRGEETVHLYTIHMAKGLEFPIVYLTNLSHDRFPTILRHTGFALPAQLVHHRAQEGEHLREERRLAYVAVTRAKERLVLTRAEQYGGGRPRQQSVFLTELPHQVIGQRTNGNDKTPKTQKSSVQPLSHQTLTKGLLPGSSPIHLTPAQIEDYLTCPLRYRYAHLDRMPVPDSGPLMAGHAIHQAIEFFFSHSKCTIDQLIKIIEREWHSTGFISAKHETARKAATISGLQQFFKTFHALPRPLQVEQAFEFAITGITIHGRYDAIFNQPLPDAPPPPLILDFKTSDSVTTAEQAAQRAKNSLQLTLYAYAWQKQTGVIPSVGLYFPAHNVFGWSKRTTRQLENVSSKIAGVAQDIRERKFAPTPSAFACGFCPWHEICPASLSRD